MIKLQQKQVKIISILIAVVFVGSVVALALTQSGSGIASAATSSVGVVDYRQVGSQHPQLAARRMRRCRRLRRRHRRTSRRSLRA